MTITPDRHPGPALEEELQLQNNPGLPSVVGAIRNNNGNLEARDQFGTFNLRAAGLTPGADGQVLMTVDGAVTWKTLITNSEGIILVNSLGEIIYQ